VRIIIHTKYGKFTSFEFTKAKFEKDTQRSISEFIEMLFTDSKHFYVTGETGSVLYFPTNVLKTSVIEIKE
jgi:hypothetical protein